MTMVNYILITFLSEPSYLGFPDLRWIVGPKKKRVGLHGILELITLKVPLDGKTSSCLGLACLRIPIRVPVST